ncbi:hypothetical protein SprV_0602167000 [Sparganum proliferum]
MLHKDNQFITGLCSFYQNDHDGAHVSPKVETPWERGLRLARERLLKAKLRRQTEADLEEKKLKLTVTAPETTEEDQLATGEIGASRVADVFWLNYYKLATVGCTQLTGKRSLPCDIAVPSAAKLAYWRRHHGRSSQRPHHRHQQSDFVRTQVRSGSQSSASSTADSIEGRSRTSSLSSLAGSIFLAVPELAADDESDRDEHQRRRRRRHSSGSSSSSAGGGGGAGGGSASSHSPNRRVTSPLRGQRSGGRRYAQVDAPPSAIAVTATERNRRHRRYGGSSRSRSSFSASGSSSSSSSSSRPTAGAAYSRERSRSPRRRPPGGPPHKPFANTNQVPTTAGNIWRGRRPPMAYLEPPRQNLPRAVDKSSADRAGKNEYERNQGDSRWPLERGVRPNISPEKIAPPHSEMPTKSPWEDVPGRNRATPGEAPVYRSPSRSSRRSRASRSPAKERDQPPEAGAEVATEVEKTTFITSWSQAESPSPRHSSRQEITETRDGHSRPLSRRLPSNQHQLPDVVPTTVTPKSLRKRGPSQMRRKSRSPFGDIEIGSNQPAPTPASSLYGSHVGAGRQPPDATISQPTPFEQTVPLLAGAVNPVNPLLPPLSTQTSIITGGGGGASAAATTTEADGRSGGELPAASSRPGVKLTIAPRVKVPVLRPGSGLKTKQPSTRQAEPPTLGDDDDSLTDRLLPSRRRDPVDESRRSRHHQRLQRQRGNSLSRRSDGADSDGPSGRGRSPARVARDASRSAVSPLARRRLREPLRREEEEEVVPKRSRLGYTAVSPGDLDSQDFQLLPMERDARRGFEFKEAGVREPCQDRGSLDSRDNYAGDGHRRMGDGGSRSRYDDQRSNKRDMDLERGSYGQSQYRGRGVERRSDFDVPETVDAYASSYRHRPQYEDRGRSGPSAADNQRRYRSSNKRSAGDGGGESPSALGYRSYRREGDSPPTEAFASRRSRTRAGGAGTRVERSRSPFESSHNREDAAAAEQRLNELRKRLTVVDDAIAELRAHHSTTKTVAGMR